MEQVEKAPAGHFDKAHNKLNAGTVAGKSLEYTGKWGGFSLEVSLKNLEARPDLFMISIKSPFFNMVKELFKKDVLDELEKILTFLEYEEYKKGKQNAT